MQAKYVNRVGEGGRVLVARVKTGSDLLLSIERLVEEEGMKAGVILSGVGLLKRACLRNCRTLPKEHPITDVNRSYLNFERPLEIIAVSGNVSEFKGKPQVHVHVTLSYVEGEKISVIGGHLVEGCIIFGFAEVFIMELKDVKMRKEFDGETKRPQLFVDNGLLPHRE